MKASPSRKRPSSSRTNVEHDDPPEIMSSLPPSELFALDGEEDDFSLKSPSSKPLSYTADDSVDLEMQNRNNPRRSGDSRNYGVGGIWVLVGLILVIGSATSAAFLTMGIKGTQRDQDLRFERHASEFVKAFQARWTDYEVAAMWAHEACRSTADQVKKLAGRISLCTRQDFSELYLYLLQGGLPFNFVSFLTMIFDPERSILEEESRVYHAEHHPDFAYRGVTGYVRDEGTPFHFHESPREEQAFYLTAHYVEPFAGNEWLVDFDMMSLPRPNNETAIQEELEYLAFQPVLSERMLFPSQNTTAHGYNVLFLHPGISLPDHHPSFIYDPSGMGIYVPDLLYNVASSQSEKTLAYVFDDDDTSGHESAFLAGIMVDPTNGDDGPLVEYQEEIDVSKLLDASECRSEKFPVVNRHWTVVVCKASGTYVPKNLFIILGGIIIFFACSCLALWLWASNRRLARFNEFKAAAEREKAALLIKNAERVAAAEKEMNEYISHEIRNPIAAAITACSFVSSAVNESMPLQTEESRDMAREDVSIISSSLQFTNDLLRTMIDMHKALHNRLHVDMTPTSVLHDVLEPVAAMFHTRGFDFEVQYHCDPENMIIATDRIRLKQIVVNLAGNAKKFVQKGYIRMSATVVDGKVELSVSDSGPGIPPSKRPLLFQKYQESLDSLSQGTGTLKRSVYVVLDLNLVPTLVCSAGMGLCLCKSLSKLLGGDLFLDESFDSGIEGCPGTRFVLKLNQAPEVPEDEEDEKIHKIVDEKCQMVPPESFEENSSDGLSSVGPLCSPTVEQICGLPEKLSVLIVDDDLILRRLISRTLKQVAPSWNISQASNGETALLLADSHQYDLIFLDQVSACHLALWCLFRHFSHFMCS